MENSFVVATLGAAAVTWLIYTYALRPLLFPEIPLAHPLCALTSTWFKRRCAHSREQKTLYAAHEKYGPIVRVAPNEVSVVSLEGLKKVYVGALDKDVWYQQTFYNYGQQNLVCTLDHKTHSEFRKMIAGLYSKSYLQRSVDMEVLSNQIILDRFLPLLETWSEQQENVNVLKLFQWVSCDFITDYIFGSEFGTNFLRDKESRDRYFDEWDRLRDNPEIKAKPVTDAMYMDMCIATVSSRDSKGTSPLVVKKMYEEISSRDQELGISKDKIMARCASEMMDMVLATQEANTTTWTYILYRMSQQPELQVLLRKELQSLHSDGTVNPSDRRLASPSDIDSLPLLDAIVQETLRLHTANPARLPRVVPKSGLTLHEIQIPAGTKISTNAYCLHRNADAFPEPLEWIPQRWLPQHSQKTKADSRWFWAFGSGPRMCVGQHFAMQAIYTQYNTTIIDDDGIEQADAYNSAPVGNKLILRFHKVDTNAAALEMPPAISPI